MNIFLIVLGGIIIILCGSFYLGTNRILHDPDTWKKFMEEGEKRNMDIPEDYMYQLVSKINWWAGFGLIIGIISLAGGILLCTIG